MRKTILSLVCCALLLSFASIGGAADNDFSAVMVKKLEQNKHPIDQLISSVQGALLVCSVTRSLNSSIAKSEDDGIQASQEKLDMANFNVCISKHRDAIKNMHGLVQKALKTGAQRAAAKEYYVLAITALEGISPMLSERVIDYERRVNGEKRALDLQETRLEAEK